MNFRHSIFFMVTILATYSCSSVKKTEDQSKSADSEKQKPNVIFFALDDMNDFINPLGYGQAVTPNLDRLAEMGVTFTNAHAPNSYCAPSRTAIWTGLQSTTTGCYRDEVYFYDYPNLVPMQEAFLQAGYKTYGAGKLFHHRPGHVDLDGWTEYYTRNEDVRKKGINTGYHGDDLPVPDPQPHSSYYRKTGKTELIGAGFIESGPIPNEDAHKMMGVKRTKWICDLLSKKHEDPFFMGLGLYTPHFPNYAPQKYFDLYEMDKIVVPELFEGDLEDLPEPMKTQMTNRSKIQKTLEDIDAVQEAVLGYLAAVSYADGLLGEVLDALEASSYKDNTIVMLWSDQGYHIGEKGNWGKHTLWSETSRVPFMISGPNVPKGKRVENTVGLIDIYPTLMEMCKLSKQHQMDGESIVPLIQGESKEERNLFIPYHEKGSYSVINEKYRYIYYKEGGEEFYDRLKDPDEHFNLVKDEYNRSIIDKMKNTVPKVFREAATPKKSLELILEEDSYYWKSTEGGTPQMTL
ncbi:MAG: sulfatase [Cyclobacteriaceae bacterium]